MSNLSFISAQELKSKIGQVAILDARPKALYEKGHIPGAFSFSWEDYVHTDKSGVKYRIVAPEKLASSLGKMGIDENTPVVVYGDADKSWGGEGWAGWVFAWLGHKAEVKMLSGGIDAWQKAGGSMETATSSNPLIAASQKTYSVSMNPAVNISAEVIGKKTHDFSIIDTRSLMERIKGARIDGSVHIPWEKFYQEKDGLRIALDKEALLRLYAAEKVDLSKKCVFYCTGGIRSGFAWFVHTAAFGADSCINFEGGTEEWEKR